MPINMKYYSFRIGSKYMKESDNQKLIILINQIQLILKILKSKFPDKNLTSRLNNYHVKVSFLEYYKCFVIHILDEIYCQYLLPTFYGGSTFIIILYEIGIIIFSLKQQDMITIFQLLLLLVIGAVFYIIVYQQFIHPLIKMNFYRKQGIQCEFVPLTGSNPNDGKNVIEKGDYYYDWLGKSLGKERSKLFCKNIGSVVALILTDPDLVKEMFINKDDFIKHEFQNGLVKSLSPFGLVLSEGALWKRHRILISKGFQYNRVDSLLQGVQKISKNVIERLSISDQKSIPSAFNFFKQSAGNIISLTYFQQDIASLKIDGKSMPVFLSDLIAQLTNQSYSWRYCIFGMKLVSLGLFNVHKKLNKDIKRMRICVKSILDKHAQNRNKQQFSMWNIFLDQQNPEGPLSQDEIIDEFITFFSDGVYTTGHFMTMMTYNLAKNPQWKQKLRHQLKQNLYNVEKPTQSLIKQLPILNACTKQTLRIMPPVVTGIQRIATKDTVFEDGTKVKKDTMVMACHLVNHLDPNLHDDPLKFDPNRWLDPQSKTLKTIKQYPGSFIPFSIGQRRCPGQKFAMAQAAIFLSRFLNQFDYEILDEKNYQLKFTQRFLRQPLEQFGLKLKPLN